MVLTCLSTCIFHPFLKATQENKKLISLSFVCITTTLNIKSPTFCTAPKSQIPTNQQTSNKTSLFLPSATIGSVRVSESIQKKRVFGPECPSISPDWSLFFEGGGGWTSPAYKLEETKGTTCVQRRHRWGQIAYTTRIMQVRPRSLQCVRKRLKIETQSESVTGRMTLTWMPSRTHLWLCPYSFQPAEQAPVFLSTSLSHCCGVHLFNEDTSYISVAECCWGTTCAICQ